MLLTLGIIWALLFGAELGLLAYGRYYLAGLAGLAASVTVVSQGIISHIPLVTGLGVLSIVLWFVFWHWGGRGRHKRTRREAIGDESRQVRDGLVRKMRARRAARPGWSPQP